MNAIVPGSFVELPEDILQKMKKDNPEILEKFYDNHLPIRRMLQPKEIAELVCFLMPDHVNYMAGAIIPIDGEEVMIDFKKDL